MRRFIMNKDRIEFQAENVAIESRDGAYIVGFSSSISAAPELYVILQRSIQDTDDDHSLGHDIYYVEVSGIGSGYGGIQKVTLSNDKLSLQINQPSKYFGDLGMIIISFNLNSDEKTRLENQIRSIFRDTDCQLSFVN